ncbi:MAG: hypothetical protein ACOCWI_01455, partial [Bacillota bacterium]
KCVGGQNLKRTHGLLIGPKISFVLAEAILSAIDKELRKSLQELDIAFVRFVDDYDVFLKHNADADAV